MKSGSSKLLLSLVNRTMKKKKFVAKIFSVHRLIMITFIHGTIVN